MAHRAAPCLTITGTTDTTQSHHHGRGPGPLGRRQASEQWTDQRANPSAFALMKEGFLKGDVLT